MIIAPEVDAEAATVLQDKQNIRVLSAGQLPSIQAPFLDFKRVNGGLLVQDSDIRIVDPSELKVVTDRAHH